MGAVGAVVLSHLVHGQPERPELEQVLNHAIEEAVVVPRLVLQTCGLVRMSCVCARVVRTREIYMYGFPWLGASDHHRFGLLCA